MKLDLLYAVLDGGIPLYLSKNDDAKYQLCQSNFGKMEWVSGLFTFIKESKDHEFSRGKEGKMKFLIREQK